MIEIEDMIPEEIVLESESVFPSIEILEAKLEDKGIVTPKEEQQEILPSIGYDGISRLTIDRISEEYVVPKGELEVTNNGTQNVTNYASVNVNVQPLLESKTITPNKSVNVVIPSSEFYGLSKVQVNAIPESYVEPNGTLEINENGLKNVKDYDSVNVNVNTSGDMSQYYNNKLASNNTTISALIKELPIEVDTSNITSLQQFAYNYSNLEKAPIMDTSNITNMYQMFGRTSLTEFPDYDYSKVENIGGAFENTKISNASINLPKATMCSYLFSGCTELTEIKEITLPSANSCDGMFSNCSKLITIPSQITLPSAKNCGNMFATCGQLRSMSLTIPNLNTCPAIFKYCGNIKIADLHLGNSITNCSQMFARCNTIKEIKLNETDFGKATNVSTMFDYCMYLEDLDGLKNIGGGYLTTASANYSYYTIDFSRCNKISHNSLMNVINDLYDIASKGCKVQRLNLGATNRAKLSEEEIAIATNKGWTII